MDYNYENWQLHKITACIICTVVLLNIDNQYFEQMIGQIYPTELQLNKANSSDTEAPFLDLNLSITNGIVSSKIYDKRDDFNFEIVNFPFLDRDVPRSTSYGVHVHLKVISLRTISKVLSHFYYTLMVYVYYLSIFCYWHDRMRSLRKGVRIWNFGEKNKAKQKSKTKKKKKKKKKSFGCVLTK